MPPSQEAPTLPERTSTGATPRGRAAETYSSTPWYKHTHTHTHTHTHAPARTRTRTQLHGQTPLLAHTHTHTRTPTHPPTLTHTHTQVKRPSQHIQALQRTNCQTYITRAIQRNRCAEFTGVTKTEKILANNLDEKTVAGYMKILSGVWRTHTHARTHARTHASLHAHLLL